MYIYRINGTGRSNERRFKFPLKWVWFTDLYSLFMQLIVVSLGTKSKHEERRRRLNAIKETGNFRNKKSVLMLYEGIGHRLSINHKQLIATGRLHWRMRARLHQMPAHTNSKYYYFFSFLRHNNIYTNQLMDLEDKQIWPQSNICLSPVRQDCPPLGVLSRAVAWVSLDIWLG